MFRTGDDVVSSSNGICKITDVVEMDLANTHVMKSYFLLEPITGNHAKVYIPLETAERRVRKAMEKKDAIRMIRLTYLSPYAFPKYMTYRQSHQSHRDRMNNQ